MAGLCEGLGAAGEVTVRDDDGAEAAVHIPASVDLLDGAVVDFAGVAFALEGAAGPVFSVGDDVHALVPDGFRDVDGGISQFFQQPAAEGLKLAALHGVDDLHEVFLLRGWLLGYLRTLRSLGRAIFSPEHGPAEKEDRSEQD